MASPTFRTMKTEEFKDAIFYRCACACGDPECDLTIELEVDEYNYLCLTLYQKMGWNKGWKGHNCFVRAWRRIKASLAVLFIGYIEVDESFMFNGKEHIISFLAAIEVGMAQLKDRKGGGGWKLNNT